MANKVKILVNGYAKDTGNGWIASSTATLIECNSKKIIVDPGCGRKKLMKALKDRGLETGDIDYVFITHNHTDHDILTGTFENAKVVTSHDIYTDDLQTPHDRTIEELDLELVKTPGHSTDSMSFIVKAEEGVYAIVGDLFWWSDDEKQESDRENLINHYDPYAKDVDTLKKSRKRILTLADYIIPGHGRMFKA